MSTTANLGMTLPAGTDWADIAVLNANFELIDAAMGAARAAEAYSAAKTYAVGDYCTRNGALFKCIVAITAPEAWTAGHWKATSMGAEFKAIYAALEGKAAANHTHTAAQVGADASGAAAAVQANLAAHAGNTTAHLTATERTAWNGKANTVTLTCTVPVAWTASGDFFYQNVSVPGMLATDNPVTDILTGADNAANKLYAEA